MADPVVVRCPSCNQKYRMDASAQGHKVRCKKCGEKFVVARPPVPDDDTVLGWMQEDEVKPKPAAAPAVAAAPRPVAPKPSAKRPAARAATPGPDEEVAAADVHLVRIEEDGALFEFPASALSGEAVRSALPRKCVGCGTKKDLEVHLIYWPERMGAAAAGQWKDREETVVGKLDAFAKGAAILAELPPLRHLPPPFNLPFPVFSCEYCHPAREVIGHVHKRGRHEVCHLKIASLMVAVGFFRSAGGRNTPEYHRLIEERDLRHDAWREVDADVRHRLAHWFEPQAGERFVKFFRDAEFSAAEAGNSGIVVTDRRVVFKKYAAFRDYRLADPCQLEVRPHGNRATVRIIEEGHRPAVVELEPGGAETLATTLRGVGCHWNRVR